MKRMMIAAGLTVGLLVMVSTAGATRTWVPELMKVGTTPVICLEHPTLALQLGTMPVVVTNGEPGSPSPVGARRTPFGWEYYGSGMTYVAGDGGRNIVSASLPVNYGADGYFYTPSGTSSSSYAMAYRGGAWTKVSTPWPYGTGGSSYQQPAVDTDVTGNIYMVLGNQVGMFSGGTWSASAKSLNVIDSISGLGIQYVSELAVSPFGEVAVSGYSSSGYTKTVAWYDFKTASWHGRAVATGMNNADTIGIEWDKNGNLGVAYADNMTRVKFDYLDMESGLWTSDVVLDNSTGQFKGAALAFDRFANPVIASGQFLIYDPVVPEPVSVALLLAGGLLLRRRRH